MSAQRHGGDGAPSGNPDAAAHRRRGNALLGSGRFLEAVASYRAALELEPGSVRAHNNLGQALLRLQRADEARQSFERAIAIDPGYAIAHNNLGTVLFERGEVAQALACHQRAVALDPGSAEAQHNCGNALAKLQRPQQALEHFERALALKPASIETLVSRGNVLQRLERFEAALDSYVRALQLAPDHVGALCNGASALLALKRTEEALGYAERAIRLRGELAEAHSNLGGALRAAHRMEEAQAACERALELKPELAEAWSNLANVMLATNRTAEAVRHCDRAIALRPDFAEAYDRRAWALLLDKRPDESARSYERLFEIDPGRDYTPGALLGAKLAACEWSGFEELRAQALQGVRAGRRVVSPFALLTLSDCVATQLQNARIFAADQLPPVTRAPWSGRRHRHERIRLAYLSADFHYHATAMLAAGMFEAHDRERFETVAISFGPEDAGPVRQRLARAFDQFHDVRRLSDPQIADMMRSLEIDIAVDLKGYTQDCRLGICALRAAPVQVSYLGYPGTLGLEEMDYILADRIVLPPEHREHYSEQVVYLPECYQVNDDRRAIAGRTPSREEAGLPPAGFVFCCFNNNHKITPTVFEVWTRLLARVPGSVLWLLQDNPAAARNLRREAAHRGIDPERLIFASRLPVDEHLARHRLADLFLDTLPYNAHTTSSDALWAGLPVLTCLGGAFPGRVAASVLHAVGLPELVTSDLAHYEARALELAGNVAELADLRARLARNRETCPLFDTRRFTRHIEAAYEMMWERHQNGLPPGHLDVPPHP
jgi:predicted O-linked N-acetylglucosamine transferase (SPINDLY family)